MTEIGTVIDGKYEILKEIGRGGMSVVYLAMDKNLNKQWAVKEIRKKGNGKNDEIVVNSLLAEADMMKRLDHPALPRIVSIIDNGITIYIVMDYIEGESLDRIINDYGAQPEELVINWAKQICDALGYLHSQKPPIIYRDMKPANVMLKPEGNIKIIDFGIAREYKEQNLTDTTVLGTKGYAPPEQYSGQTDPRSDIFALGMTMHHLLTGVDPRKGEAYKSVRQWNPGLSEGIELIVDKCVEPAAENRYQSCAELLYDLDHPDLITKGYKQMQRKKLMKFVIPAIICIVMLIIGVTTRVIGTKMNNSSYEALITSSNIQDRYEAIDLYPSRVYSAEENQAVKDKNARKDAYNQLIEYYQSHGAKLEDIERLGNKVIRNRDGFDESDKNVAELYYNVGKLYFSELTSSFKSKSSYAKTFFESAVKASEKSGYEKKEIVECYLSICNFMTNQSKTQEPDLKEYKSLIKEMKDAEKNISKVNNKESNYDKITMYYVELSFLSDQAPYLASVGYDINEVKSMMQNAYSNAMSITSSLAYVENMKSNIEANYDSYVTNVDSNYKMRAKFSSGGVE